MIKSIDEYLDQLKTELKDSDSATVQDALADAEEHLRTALTILKQDQPEMSEEEALSHVIEQYGSPDETASAYKEVERRTSPSLARETPLQQGSMIKRFLNVYDDPKAWGALLYMLISLVTGIVYFTWARNWILAVRVVRQSLFSDCLLHCCVFHGFCARIGPLLEGTVVEGLLGVRMPRRSLFFQKGADMV